MRGMTQKAGSANPDDDKGPAARRATVSPSASRPWMVATLIVVIVGIAGLLVWELSGSPEMPAPEAAHEDWLGDVDAVPQGPSGRVRTEFLALKQEAAGVVRSLLEQYPDTAESLDVVALFHLRLGMAENALRCWRRSVELDPHFATAHFAMGLLARDQGRLAASAGHFQKAAELDPEMPGVFVELADVLIKQSKLDEAQAVVEKSLKRDPRFLPGLYHLGQIYLQRKDYAKARKTLEAAIRYGPDFTNAYFGLATACAKLGDTQRAAQYMQRFKALGAGDEQAHRDLVKATRDFDDPRQSVAVVCTAAARVWLLHGEAERAEPLLLRACQLAPGYAESGDLLARLYERQGREEEALKTLTRFSVSSPTSIAIQVHLAALASKMGRFELAEQAYHKAIELSPGEVRAYAMLAGLYLQLGRNLPEAKRLAQKAVELDPAARNFFLLAIACRRTGDLRAALAALDRALALEPENQEFRRARDSLRPEDGGVELPPLPK